MNDQEILDLVDKNLSKQSPEDSLTTQIIRWNRDHNGLAFDPILEIRLLSESAHEFFMVDNLADRLRVMVNFSVVASGTLAKFAGQQFDSVKVWHDHWVHYQDLEKWIDFQQETMADIVVGDLKPYAVDITGIIDQVMQIIVKAHNQDGPPVEDSIKWLLKKYKIYC